MTTTFEQKVKAVREHHEKLLSRKNIRKEWGNGIYDKYESDAGADCRCKDSSE